MVMKVFVSVILFQSKRLCEPHNQQTLDYYVDLGNANISSNISSLQYPHLEIPVLLGGFFDAILLLYLRISSML